MQKFQSDCASPPPSPIVYLALSNDFKIITILLPKLSSLGPPPDLSFSLFVEHVYHTLMMSQKGFYTYVFKRLL